MSDRADAAITRVADTMPDLPISVAFFDQAGNPGWIGDNPALQIHRPGIRGCWPKVEAVSRLAAPEQRAGG